MLGVAGDAIVTRVVCPRAPSRPLRTLPPLLELYRLRSRSKYRGVDTRVRGGCICGLYKHDTKNTRYDMCTVKVKFVFGSLDTVTCTFVGRMAFVQMIFRTVTFLEKSSTFCCTTKTLKNCYTVPPAACIVTMQSHTARAKT